MLSNPVCWSGSPAGAPLQFGRLKAAALLRFSAARPNGGSRRAHLRWHIVCYHRGGLRLREVGMLGFSRRQLFKASAAVVLAVGTVSLLLIYFIPAPPSTVTMATAFKGSSFEYFGHRYRDIFKRSHVELELRETEGAVDNIELLKDASSGVQIALAFGGISDEKRVPGVLSLGTVYTNPFWVFYS